MARATTVLARDGMIRVDLVDEDPDNARQTFDPGSLASLAETMKARIAEGKPPLMYPIRVRSAPGDRVKLTDGARRLRCVRDILKLPEIQYVWEDVDDIQAARDAAVANLQREGLTPYEEARAFQRLVDLGMQKKEICRLAGVVFHTLDDRLKLLALPESVGRRVGLDGFTMGHAKTLLPLAKHPDLLQAALEGFDMEAAKGRAPDARRFGEFLAQVLMNRGLLVDPERAIDADTRSGLADFEDRILELPHIILDVGYAKEIFVTDPALLKNKGAEWAAELETQRKRQNLKDAEKEPKSQQDHLKQEAQAKKAEQAEKDRRRAEREIEAIKIGLKLTAAAAKLKSGKTRGIAAWVAIASWVGNDGLQFAYIPDEQMLAYIVECGKALGAPADQVRSSFVACFDLEEEGGEFPDPSKPPAWFLKLHNDAQLGLLAGLLIAADLKDDASLGARKACEALTGESEATWAKRAAAKHRDEQAAKGKPAKQPGPGLPKHATCGICGKSVALTSAGFLHLHATPIPDRKGDRHEQCPGGGKKPEPAPKPAKPSQAAKTPETGKKAQPAVAPAPKGKKSAKELLAAEKAKKTAASPARASKAAKAGKQARLFAEAAPAAEASPSEPAAIGEPASDPAVIS